MNCPCCGDDADLLLLTDQLDGRGFRQACPRCTDVRRFEARERQQSKVEEAKAEGGAESSMPSAFDPRPSTSLR